MRRKRVPLQTGGNPLLNRMAAAPLNSHGRKSEARVAPAMGARLHRNSGAPVGHKSDASLTEDRFRLEMKSSTADTLRLELAWLVKISQEALHHGQRPGVVFSFVDIHGRPAMKHYAEWIALPIDVFRELLDVLKE